MSYAQSPAWIRTSPLGNLNAPSLGEALCVSEMQTIRVLRRFWLLIGSDAIEQRHSFTTVFVVSGRPSLCVYAQGNSQFFMMVLSVTGWEIEEVSFDFMSLRATTVFCSG